MKSPSLRTLLLATLLVASFVVNLPGVPATPPDGAGPPNCPGFRSERGLGDVCPRADGLLEVFHPGNHRSVGYTHGLDPAPDGNEPSTPAGPIPPTCVSGAAGTYHVKVFYARAYNDVDNYASSAGMIRSLVEQANGLVYSAGVATGGVATLNVQCTGGVVDVINAVLPTAMASASFSTIVTDIRNMGYTDGKVKHWVYYDDTGACSCGGTGHIYGDDSLAVSNLNNGNGGARYAVTFGYNSARIMMHELGHNMGAVQNSAPHSTLAWHCYDGFDTMCYNDGGPNGGLYSPGYCGGEIFDCGKDDYFHRSPTSGSYLATHWNLGNTMNRFMSFGDVTLPEPGECDWNVDGGETYWTSVGGFPYFSRDLLVPAGCPGHPFNLTASNPLLADFDMCTLNRGDELDCYTNVGPESGVLSVWTTTARVYLRQGTMGEFHISAFGHAA